MCNDRHWLVGRGVRQTNLQTWGTAMLSQSLIVARKEVTDGLRDVRSVISSLLYAIMGPLVVGLVSLAPGIRQSNPSPIPALMSVFTVVAAFSGGMNIAMDTMA